MTYAIVIAVAAGLVMIGGVAAAVLLARSLLGLSTAGVGPVGGWTWFPSGLGWLLFLALPLLGLLLWRAFPVFLFLPFVFPFVWRWRRGPVGTSASNRRRRNTQQRASNGHRTNDGEVFEGSVHAADDE
jgi:hypothetical protein